jgi:hypothetical protein
MSNKKQEIASAEVESTQQENNQVVTTQSNAVVEVNSDNFDGLDRSPVGEVFIYGQIRNRSVTFT